MLWRATSRKIFRDVSRLALLISSNLVTDILPKMYDQEPEMRMIGEIPEESDIMLPRDSVRSNESSKINDVLDTPDHLTSRNQVTTKAESPVRNFSREMCCLEDSRTSQYGVIFC